MSDAASYIRPDTYLLQRAMDTGLAAVAARLDPSEGHRPYFSLRLKPSPGLEHDIWDLGDMCSRYVDAHILGRQVTGNTGYVEQEAALRALLHTCDPYLNPFMATRMVIAYVDEYLQSPSGDGRNRIDELVRTIRSRMTLEEDYAYFFRHPDGWSTWNDAVFGDFTGYPTYPLGGIILGLARYLEASHAPEASDLLDRLCRFVLGVSGTFRDDGSYRGHTHSGGILTAAAGIFRWGLLRGDSDVVAQMKGAFDWTAKNSSSWGWIPDGLCAPNASSETCSITDAIHLGLLIAKHVDTSYYGVVERYVRNHLLESQFLKPERMLPAGELDSQVAKALHGSWASASNPNSFDGCLSSTIEGCCLGSGIRACFLAWDHTVEKRDDVVRINMAFGRNSPWAEVISYQPYEGRVEVIMHEAAHLEVRIPAWAPGHSLRVSLNSRPAPLVLAGGYARVESLKPGDCLRIDYPLLMQESVETLSGRAYAATWRGDTVVGIEPRGETYPLYERSHLNQETAPLVSGRPYYEQTGGPVHW